MYSHPPLLKRIVKAHQSSAVCVTGTSIGTDDLLSPPLRGCYKRWDSSSMDSAIKEVEQGNMSLRQAAEVFSVPKSSLYDRVTGKVAYGARSGPSPYLTRDEEEELAKFLIEVAKIGYPRNRKQVLALVQRVIEGKGIVGVVVSNGWWERFRERHPQLTLKSAVPMSFARAVATDHMTFIRYFDILEETLRSNDIFNKAVHIFNCDETGLPLSPTSLKVVDKVGSKHPSYLTGNQKSQITVLACSCAAGYVIPPFVIFNRKSLNEKLTEGEIPGTLYGLSANGWMTQQLFLHWFTNHFLLYAPQIRPLLLLLDGHSSHYNPETIRTAAQNQVIVFAFPPNTTHVTQPLDRGCFGPLKMYWRRFCHEFVTKNPGRTVTQYEFSKLFSKAWSEAFSIHNIISSFKVTGICPFDRSVYGDLLMEEKKLDDEPFSSFGPESLAQKTGLAYIPLYSPAVTPSKSVIGTRILNRSEDDMDICISPPYTLHSRAMERSFSDSQLHDRDFREGSLPTKSSSIVTEFLSPVVPPNKMNTKKTKSAGVVLTSHDYLKSMEEKERKKEIERLQKEERKRLREEKARLKKKSNEATKRRMNKKDVSTLTFEESFEWSEDSEPETKQEVQTRRKESVTSGRLQSMKKDSDPRELLEPVTRGKLQSRKKAVDSDPIELLEPVTRGKLQSRKKAVDSDPIELLEPVTRGKLQSRKKAVDSDPIELLEPVTRGKLQSRKKDSDPIELLEPVTRGKLQNRKKEQCDEWWIQDLCLYMADKDRLENGSDLSDGIINAAQALLKQQFCHVHGFQNTLCSHGLKFVPVSTVPAIQILHIGSNHWICTSCHHPGNVQVLDSLALFFTLDEVINLQLSKIYSLSKSQLKITVCSVQQQEGNHDCGLFAIAAAMEICCGINPETVTFHQDKMRTHLINCFEERRLSHFPKTASQELIPRPSRRHHVIKLFCVCFMPEQYDEMMISCDTCQRWFHCSCVHVKPTNIPSYWHCHNCS